MLDTIYVVGLLFAALLFFLGVETQRGEPSRPVVLTVAVVCTAIAGYAAWLLAFPSPHVVTMGVGGMIDRATALVTGWGDLALLWGFLGLAAVGGYKLGYRRGV